MFGRGHTRGLVEPQGRTTDFRVYIAGPISGDLVANIPPFFDAERVLVGAGHTVFNPARLDGGRNGAEAVDRALMVRGSKTWEDYMRQGISGLLDCNAIALLPGWNASPGARLERDIAQALKMAIISSHNGLVVTNPKGVGRRPVPRPGLIASAWIREGLV